jgi:broad specificity phosphatase PhoE
VFFILMRDAILVHMKLIVVRHGETNLNKEDRLQGSKGPNEGLNDTGRFQVAHLRDELLLIPQIIYASPLLRTQETAHILNERFAVPIITTPALMERDFGTLSGKLRSEIDPKIVEDDLEGHYDYHPYGGESVEDVRRRVQSFVDSLRAHKENLVMLVTHRGIIRVLYDLYPDNAFAENIVPASKHIFDT